MKDVLYNKEKQQSAALFSEQHNWHESTPQTTAAQAQDLKSAPQIHIQKNQKQRK